MDGCGLQVRSGPAHGGEPSFKNHAARRLNAKGATLKEDYFLVRSEAPVCGVFSGGGGAVRRPGREGRCATLARLGLRHPWRGKLI